jgi:hypothetical protein
MPDKPKPPARDPLGRPWRYDDDAPPWRDLLTDDQVTAIAHDARTRAITEVGRHVWPLIRHIVALDGRECRNCRFWVAYNRGRDITHRGECTNPEALRQVRAIDHEGGPAGVVPSLETPFDWSCKGWEEQAQEACDAQSCPGA